MSLEYITKVLRVEVNSTQKLLLIVLANYSDEFGCSYPSHKKLTELTGLSLTAIKDNLKKLRDMGYIEWEQRKNTSNYYKILGGSADGYGGSAGGYNTKAYTKDEFILDIDLINEIYKKKCDQSFYAHTSNAHKYTTPYKKLKEIAKSKKGYISPKTGKKIDFTSKEFWEAYFDIANSEGHKKWIRSFWDGRPTLGTMLGINQFDAIIERRHG
jgi:biotin operon repressor